MKRLLAWAGGTALALMVAFALVVQVRQTRAFDVPEPALRATDDPEVVERGRYLVFGPAPCAACHAPGEMVAELSLEEDQPPLSGGFEYPLPFGTLRFPNITPDPETGIGRYTDGQLARVLAVRGEA